jgi:hypothetical protein
MKYLLLLGLLLISVTSVYAQVDSSTFNVRFSSGADTTPPTTPVLVSADPISPTQVDLAWTTATDNFSLSGYVIIRGSSTLATTTLTTFSDTSVSASTTYLYSVQAFDSALNYSSSSNSISTTTPDFPTVPPVIVQDDTTEGTIARIVAREVTITPDLTTAALVVETARPVRLTVRWGRFYDYELGYSSSEFYSKNHAVQLTDLEPGTTYDYEIIAETPFGLLSVIKTGQFTTLENSISNIPPNVSRFLAVSVGTDVRLSWQLPSTENIAFVRVVRSHLGFPTHPRNGAVVYQGLNTEFADEDILSEYSPVYYTAFVYSLDGKVSSGAIAVVYSQSDFNSDQNDEAIGLNVPSTPEKITEATSTVTVERLTPEMRLPELSDIFVKQSEVKYSFLDAKISLSSASPFIVQIPVESIAGNLKSIIGTLLDPTDNNKSYSFLLRINEDMTNYEAVIPALLVSGESVLEVAIYDYEALVVATYTSPISFVEQTELLEPVFFPDVFFRLPTGVMLGGILLGVLLLTLLLVFRYRHEDKV